MATGRLDEAAAVPPKTDPEVVPTDPAVIERAGIAMADRLVEVGTPLVVCWYGPEDAVLAHVVGRQLGTRVHYLTDVDGILKVVDELAGPADAIFVTWRLWRGSNLAGVRGLVAYHGCELVAVAAVEADENYPVDAVSGPSIAVLSGTAPTTASSTDSR